jgi:hypothetical protein
MNKTTTKYPKTWHAPWSDSMSSDDHWHTNMDHFKGKRVVVREKMDGECTTGYEDGKIHARSEDSRSHLSQDFIRRDLANVLWQLPNGWRICLENVYALHSIFYILPTYSFLLNVWDEDNICLSDSDTRSLAKDLGLWMPPVIYEGVYDEQKIKDAWTGKSVFQTLEAAPYRQLYEAKSKHESVDMSLCKPTTGEGYVIRMEDPFGYDDFKWGLAKYVRAGHVQTSKFWKNELIIPNGLDTTIKVSGDPR